MRKIVAVAGPTAAGKTEYAIEIAKAFDGEIVSCDSMQLYKKMDIGSAKPTKEERALVPHHLVDFVDPEDEMTCAKYQKLAKDAINDILSRGKLPVICGGTGLYLNSLIYDMDFASSPGDKEGRSRYYEIAEKEGPEALHKLLEELDPGSAERIHENNIKRMVRAIEAAENGVPLGDISRDPVKTKDYEVILIGLTRDREELYNRINERVDVLMEKGLLDEVRSLMDSGLDSDDISMKGIGYKEIIGYFDGEYDLDEAVRLVKRNTRHFAKRQLTWFRRYDDMKWFNASSYAGDSECAGEMISWLRKKL